VTVFIQQFSGTVIVLTKALDRHQWSSSHAGYFIPQVSIPLITTHLILGKMGFRTHLDALRLEEISRPHQEQN
jgi:hypothetical protein